MTPDWIKAAMAGASGAMTMTIFFDLFDTIPRWEVGLVGLVILLGIAHILDVILEEPK